MPYFSTELPIFKYLVSWPKYQYLLIGTYKISVLFRFVSMTNNMDDLLDFFTDRDLPETAFQITKQASTANLRKCVKLAIALAREGHQPSLIQLTRIRDLLEKQPIESPRARWKQASRGSS